MAGNFFPKEISPNLFVDEETSESFIQNQLKIIQSLLFNKQIIGKQFTIFELHTLHATDSNKAKKFVLASCGKDKICVPAQWCPFAVYLNDTALHSEDPEERKKANMDFEAGRCYNETHSLINITACAPWDSIMTNLDGVSLPDKFRK